MKVLVKMVALPVGAFLRGDGVGPRGLEAGGE
jgi:hypothetical protein